MKAIIGKTAGFCYGVKRAVEGSKKQLEDNFNVYCLGELVHNKEVISDLQNKGIVFINNIDEAVNQNSKVIVRAHGITKDIYEKANLNKIDLVDYTCPNVLKIHKIAEEYESKGYYIFLCGKRNHPENIGTLSYCGENYSIIENPDEIETKLDIFRKSNIGKLLLISQTTYSLEKFELIKNKISEELSDKEELVIKNTICRATELRQKETEEISTKVDYMIIIGGKNSSNTNKLYEIAKRNCNKTILVENEKEIDKEEVEKYNLIGIMAGASTPNVTIEKVLKKLEIGMYE